MRLPKWQKQNKFWQIFKKLSEIVRLCHKKDYIVEFLVKSDNWNELVTMWFWEKLRIIDDYISNLYKWGGYVQFSFRYFSQKLNF